MSKKKKKSFTNNKKRIIILNICLVLFLMLGIGYSVLGSYLNVNGNITVKEYSLKLYDVLKDAAEEGTYAKRYTDNHQDSIDSSLSTEELYHWYKSSNMNLNDIKARFNVIFADQCWIMFRTTDTGGVKLLYNGEAENGQCLDTRGTHLGYNVSSLTSASLSSNYYYGTDYLYNKTANNYTLSGEITTGEIKKGQYTCLKTNNEGTCSSLYYVYRENGTQYDLLKIVNNIPMYLIGSSKFNTIESPASAGYMYNKYYTGSSSDNFINNKSLISKYNMSSGTSYFYSDKLIKDGNYYYLQNEDGSTPEQIAWSEVQEDNSILEGKYTCRSSTTTEISYNGNTIPQGTRCYWPYYVIDSTTYENVMMSQEISDINATPNDTMFFGEDIVDNGDGTYSLVGVSEISLLEWYTDFSNYQYYYYCTGYRDTTCERKKLNYITGTFSTGFYYESFSSEYMYSNEASYNYETEEYTLVGDTFTFWDFTNQDLVDVYRTKHYTCLNDTGVCKTLSYIYGNNLTNDKYFYYMKLKNGAKGDTLLDEMLRAEDVNKYDSTIKIYIDSWYEQKLLNYSDYLDDTIFCNNRIINNKAGWDPNNIIGSNFVYFGDIGKMYCNSLLDSFSVGNPKAQLKYKIGLLTYKESSLMNANDLYFDGTNRYWLGTPNYITDDANFYLGANGGTNNIGTSGVRPTISLKKGASYVSGTGSMENPYIVDAPPITN